MAKKVRPIIKQEIKLHLADPNNTPIEELKKLEQEEVRLGGETPLVKSILNALTDDRDKIARLAFERDPSQNNEMAALWRQKVRLIPDFLLKRLAIQDDLVAAIINARSNQISAFGRPRPDRFSLGFAVEIKPEIAEKAEDKQKEELYNRISKFEKKLLTCGTLTGWGEQERTTLPRFLWQQTRNALVLGRFATEFVYITNQQGEKEFHSFRAVDSGTIYRSAARKDAAAEVRKQAKALMEALLKRKLEGEQEVKFEEDFPWIQVIDGKPLQAFTPKEMHVHNCFPVTDIELQGYPLTPLDTVVAAVTTHINITTHNKLFFQSGRAAKGMLVIQSEDVDENTVAKIRQQFNANINNVNNSWRMPVFSVGKDDQVQFQPIETTGRDMEFQYLSDTNARVILSAFQMSPEELPGYAQLSRGTNNQALSESNKEYQLEAHRDTGIRPLLAHFEDFLNNVIFPVMDEELSKLCVLKLVGLDADTAEKEAVRISTDAPLHMTYDEILSKVEKDPIGKEFGGTFPINPQFQLILDKYFTVGQIQEKFFGVQGAAKDPQWAYVRDPFFFQNIQMQMQMQQMQMQMQQMQAQAAQGGQPPEGGGDGGGGEGGPPPEGGGGGGDGGGGEGGGGEGGQPQEGQPEAKAEDQGGSDLTTATDQMLGMLGKTEDQLPPSKRRLLNKQKKLITAMMDEWERDSKLGLQELAEIAGKFGPKEK